MLLLIILIITHHDHHVHAFFSPFFSPPSFAIPSRSSAVIPPAFFSPIPAVSLAPFRTPVPVCARPPASAPTLLQTVSLQPFIVAKKFRLFSQALRYSEEKLTYSPMYPPRPFLHRQQFLMRLCLRLRRSEGNSWLVLVGPWEAVT